jgi:hypothetical protein
VAAGAADADEPNRNEESDPIRLPLKPTVAPTIKLPARPPGGPTGAAPVAEVAASKPKKSWWKFW